MSAAREIQLQRFKGRKIYANSRMGPRDVRRFCAIGEEAEKLLETAVTKLGFSARAYDRVLKVARTIADLAGDADIGTRPYQRGHSIQDDGPGTVTDVKDPAGPRVLSLWRAEGSPGRRPCRPGPSRG